MNRLIPCLALLALVCVAASTSARAEGVTDFIIDPAVGYTITVPGSYRLAKSVVMSNPLVPAITVNANGTTLDLNGHTIDGGSLGGPEVGIKSNRVRVTVRNGNMIGFLGSWAIAIGAEARIERINVGGGAAGLKAGDRAMISDCSVTGINTQFAATGISVHNDSIVRDCIVHSVLSSEGDVIGVATGQRSTVRGCSVRNAQTFGGGGGAYGIAVGAGCNVIDNTVNDTRATSDGSDAIGIASSGGIVRGNTCSGQLSVTNGDGIGIQMSGRGLVTGNTCGTNAGAGFGFGIGIAAETACTITGNACFDQTVGGESYGIFVNNPGCLVQGNHTYGNNTAGIRLASGGSRCDSNRCLDSTPVSDDGGNSIGTGDLANSF